MYLIIFMCQTCGLICRRGYVVFPWGLAACVILGIDLLVTLKGACVCDIFLLVGFVEYLSPEEDWLTTPVVRVLPYWIAKLPVIGDRVKQSALVVVPTACHDFAVPRCKPACLAYRPSQPHPQG